MKKTREDFYIAMLRYGKENIEDGFRLDKLVKHLSDQGHFIPSEHSTLLQHYFPLTFFSKDEKPYPDYNGHFYLKPERYFQLLEYDNFVQARREAYETRVIAIVAIGLTILSIVAPWFV